MKKQFLILENSKELGSVLARRLTVEGRNNDEIRGQIEVMLDGDDPLMVTSQGSAALSGPDAYYKGGRIVAFGWPPSEAIPKVAMELVANMAQRDQGLPLRWVEST